jgi:hypothetical protein
MLSHGFSEIEWSLSPDKKGAMNLFLGGRAIHSTYDVMHHAQHSAQKIASTIKEKKHTTPIIIGLGIGLLPHHLHALGIHKGIIWDIFPAMSNHLPTPKDPWHKDFSIATSFSELCAAIKNDITPMLTPHVIIHPGYEPYCRMEYRLLLKHLRTIFPSSKPRTYEDFVVNERSLQNLTLLPFTKPLHLLIEQCKGSHAFCISPGPSLTQCIPHLQQRRGGITFAALQALPLLQKNGIYVDFVVAADPNDMSPFIGDSTLDFGALLVDTAVHPSLLSWCPEKTFFFHLRSDSFHDLFLENLHNTTIETPVATISEVMFLLTELLHCGSTTLLGMDFSWKEEHYAYRSPDAPPAEGIETTFRLQGKDEAILTTDATYFQACRYLSHMCYNKLHHQEEVSYFNEGLAIIGARDLSLEELSKLRRTVPINDITIPSSYDNRGLIARAQDLLELAASSTHLSGKKLSAPNARIPEKRMLFFEEIPPEGREKICKEYHKLIKP